MITLREKPTITDPLRPSDFTDARCTICNAKITVPADLIGVTYRCWNHLRDVN